MSRLMADDNRTAHRAETGNLMTGQFYCRPVIVLLVFFIAGITAGRYLPVSPAAAFLAWIAVSVCLLRLVLAFFRKRPATLAPLALFFVLGMLAISARLPPLFPPESVRPYIDDRPATISGTVFHPPVEQGFRTRCILKNLVFHPQNETLPKKPLPGRIQLTLYGDAPEIPPGSRVTFRRKIRSIRNFNNPGGFDYKQHMAWQDIWGTAWDNGSRIEVSSGEKPGSFFAAVSRLRIAIDQQIASVSEKDSRAVLSALVIGKKDLISPQLRESFSQAGVSHLLAISGLHVGIIAMICFFLATRILGRNTYLLKRALVKKTGAALSIFFVIGYGLIAGMSPSTQRAVIMICIFLFAYLFDRQYDPANTLAAAALGILVIFPQALFNISFQLSFAAVCAIFTGLYWIPVPAGNTDETLWKRSFKIAAGFAWVSTLAIIGTMPLTAHYFNQVSILGIAANFLLVPLVGFVIVPLGLVSALLSFFFEPIAVYGFLAAEALLRGSLFIVYLFSEIPFGAYKVVTPSMIELACLYSLMIFLPAALLAHKRCNPGGECGARATGPGKYGFFPVSRGVAASIAAVAAFILAIDSAWWIHRRYFQTDMIVTYLDVGQGNAAVLEMPKGKIMLVDGGGFTDNSRFDVGARILAPYLWQNKIRTIDKVVLSHPHSDHLNGLLYILSHFNVRKVISTNYLADTDSYRHFLEIIDKKGIVHPCFTEVPPQKNINGVDRHIFYPPQDRTQENAPSNLNNGSIVLQLQYMDTVFLFPGDVEAPAESELVDMAGSKLESDFLLSPHHGSSSSSTPGFLNAVNPDTVIVSARKGRFEFPSKEVLADYSRRGYKVLTTETHGAIRVTAGKAPARIMTVLDPEDGDG